MNDLRALTVRRASLLAFALLMVLVLGGCVRKKIPPREEIATPPVISPEQWLKGGALVFSDDFERPALGGHWTTEHPGWRIEEGRVRDSNARNAGLWLKRMLPEKTRVEFDIQSDPLTNGKAFPGDVKCEIFATRPEHQAGYVLINGGWGNKLDVIARLDEHGADRMEQAAVAVKPGQAVRWSIVRVDGTLHWFRDGKLHMSYEDPEPVAGRYLGFNNWLSNIAYDNLEVYDLK